MIDTEKVYLRFRGRTLGPFTSAKADEMLQRGQITRLHEVSADGSSWTRAEEYYRSFFNRSQAATVVEKESKKEEEKPKEHEEPSGDQWYAYFANQKQGPMSLVVLQQHVLSGSVNRDTLVWRTGLADWQPAVIVLPALFPKNMPPKDEEQQSGGRNARQGELSKELVQSFIRPRNWIMLIASFWIVLTISAILGLGFQFVVALRAPVPGPAAAFLATGFALAILVQGALLYCGILLLNYGQSLTQLKYQRSELNLIKSGNALGRFFAATGVIVLISIVGFLLLGLLVVLLAATGAEGFQSST
ncbi:MAG: hypothetical protein RLY14_1128 [Planctomycetota bacterium]